MSRHLSHSSQHLVLAFTSAVIAVVAAAYFGQLIQTMGQDLEEQIAQINEAKSKESASIQLRRLAEETQPEQAALAAYFLPAVNSFETAAFFDQTQKIWPARLGVSVELGGGQEVVEGEQTWYRLNYQITGPEPAVRSMVSVLELVPYRSRISELGFNRRTTDSFTATVVLDVALLSE